MSCGTSRNSTATGPGDHTMHFAFDDKNDKLPTHWLNFSQLIKKLLFLIPTNSLSSIDSTASVYELFDNPSNVQIRGNLCYLASILMYK